MSKRIADGVEEIDSADWSNWREQCSPWDVLKEKLSQEHCGEVRIFQKQDKLQLESKQRRKDFEETIKRAREEFEKAEKEKHLDIIYPFSHRLWV